MAALNEAYEVISNPGASSSPPSSSRLTHALTLCRLLPLPLPSSSPARLLFFSRSSTMSRRAARPLRRRRGPERPARRSGRLRRRCRQPVRRRRAAHLLPAGRLTVRRASRRGRGRRVRAVLPAGAGRRRRRAAVPVPLGLERAARRCRAWYIRRFPHSSLSRAAGGAGEAERSSPGR